MLGSLLVLGRLYLTLVAVVSTGQSSHSFLYSCLLFKRQRKMFLFAYLSSLIELTKLDNNIDTAGNGHTIPDIISRIQIY